MSIEILKGSEPVDAIFVDKTTNPITLFFAEIKAAPLTTLPLTAPAQQMTIEKDGTIPFSKHRVSDFSTLFGTELAIYVPEPTSEKHQWFGHLYYLGHKKDQTDQTWAYQGLTDLLDNTTMFMHYLDFWKTAFWNYKHRNPHPTYWFTNGCGKPVPRPDTWPHHSGKGYESVSDGKTSVGLDRTDDIKKGIYQVLKLSTEGHPSFQYNYKTGIISNIHAVRHFDEYLSSLKDIVWTRATTDTTKNVEQLPPNTELFNLLDGIITLTEIFARDEWIASTFCFGETTE